MNIENDYFDKYEHLGNEDIVEFNNIIDSEKKNLLVRLVASGIIFTTFLISSSFIIPSVLKFVELDLILIKTFVYMSFFLLYLLFITRYKINKENLIYFDGWKLFLIKKNLLDTEVNYHDSLVPKLIDEYLID